MLREPKPLTEKQLRAKEFFKKTEKNAKLVDWVKWHRRIRSGNLTEEELERIRTRTIIAPKQEVAIHLTDFLFLEKVLSEGLKKGFGEVSVITFESFDNLTGKGLTEAARSYRNVVNGKMYLDSEYHYDTISRRFFDQKKGITDYFDGLRQMLETNKDIERTHSIKMISSEESEILRKYYALYKKGDLSFLENKAAVEELIEVMARTLARRNYFSVRDFDKGKYLGSSMGVGLIYNADAVYYHKGFIIGTEQIMPGEKAIGLYVVNPNMVNSVREIMLRNAKTVNDIVPIYGLNKLTKKTELIWPKRKLE